MSDRYKEMWEDAFHDLLEKRDEISELKAENARLNAKVERLTKSGDELGEWFMDIHPSKKKWEAAKGGKQS